MKVIVSENNNFVLSLARGEELFSTLLLWAKEQGIKGGTLTGLGATDQLDLAYYNLETKEYERHPIQEEVEIVSLNGNLGWLNGEHILHIHGSFGRQNLSLFGGHLFSLRVSGACEIHVETYSTEMRRLPDDETGLNLLSEGQ